MTPTSKGGDDLYVVDRCLTFGRDGPCYCSALLRGKHSGPEQNSRISLSDLRPSRASTWGALSLPTLSGAGEADVQQSRQR